MYNCMQPSPLSDSKAFVSPKSKTLCPLSKTPRSPCPARPRPSPATTDPTPPSLQLCLFRLSYEWDHPKSDFCVWLLPLSRMFSRLNTSRLFILGISEVLTSGGLADRAGQFPETASGLSCPEPTPPPSSVFSHTDSPSPAPDHPGARNPTTGAPGLIPARLSLLRRL